MPDANYTADAVVLSDLLSTASLPIEVPSWQRSYSWKSDQVEVFWADLKRFNAAHPDDNIDNKQYFLGSIVMVVTPNKYLLLDGQQRLATATILLCALRESRRPVDESGATGRLNTKFIADYDDGSKATQYSVSLNNYDREYFRRAIQAEGVSSVLPKLRSHGLIDQAYKYFLAEIATETKDMSSEQALAYSIRIQDVLLKHFSIVSVKTSDEDTAATVFEALNDRGIGLSTPDLLRSYLLRAANGETERESIVQSWLDIFSLFEETGVEQFLRHYWVSINGDVKTRSLYREMKASFTDHGLDAVGFSTNLALAAVDYRTLKDSSDPDESIKESLEDINQLNATVLYPALMSAFAVRSTVGESALAGFTKDLLILYVRHSLILGRESTRLEAEIYSVAREIRQTSSLRTAAARIRAFAPSISDFVRGFELATVSRTDSAKYVLGKLEMNRRATDELVLANGRKVQLEHIYPQTPQVGQRLPNHSALINRIGNQTLLDHRLNASIKNGNFEAKKTNAYATSELELTKDLLSYGATAWGPEEIRSRQLALAAVAAEVWKFNAAEYADYLAQVVPDVAEEKVMVDSLPEDVENVVDVAVTDKRDAPVIV
ncbi:DUF262 domain-containing protein [Plantibacter cousiniae (nom. nud.)]|uniref:DUF262 domain-containing protein n=1 Tax=Plantibacter cousiniae (nom. nud.) TaxID=199709 RepID=A0ABY1LMM8_9MICO|nr:DUF262 domain-containing protein [Plantibacter cousiniae]SKC61805.1 Protein of unknown function [Plantibacter cousiniae]